MRKVEITCDRCGDTAVEMARNPNPLRISRMASIQTDVPARPFIELCAVCFADLMEWLTAKPGQKSESPACGSSAGRG